MGGFIKQRLTGLIKKEFIQIIRDPSAIAIAFVMPVILLFIFGYGVSLDAHHIPVAIVVDQHTHESDEFIAGLDQSPYFTPQYFSSIHDAQQAVMAQQVNVILWIRDDFDKNLYQSNTAPIAMLINGTDANNAHLIEGYLQGVWQVWLTHYATNNAKPLVIPVSTQSRIWFNPALRSRDYLVPGLIAVIMTLIGALLTALVVAREWERGTMEALMASPVTISEILLGKLIPYFIMGMGGMLLSVALAVFLFHVPLIGNFFILLFLSALFLLVALGMGLFISSVAKNQFVAGQIAIIVTFLPAFILSGFIFDIHSMPVAIQAITHIVAARYYVAILQTLFLAGDVGSILISNGIALFVMAIFFLGLTWLRSRKRLD